MKPPMVPYSKLYCLATGGEKLMFYFSFVFSALSGAAMPVTFAYLLGDAFDIFNPKESEEDF
jgi:hypothetical protein